MPYRLRTEYAENPLGIDVLTPRFSWLFEGKQTAYRLLCASSPELFGRPDLWDSGRVDSMERTLIRYEGPSLVSKQKVYWVVRVWDSDENFRESSSAWFEMGLLHQGDWKAEFLNVPCNGGGGRGYFSGSFPAAAQAELWVQIDLGREEAFESIVLWAVQCPEAGPESGNGLGFPERFRIEGSSEPEFLDPEAIYETPECVVNPGQQSFEIHLSAPVCHRFVRITVLQCQSATGPDPGQEQFFAIDEMQVFRGMENIALGRPVHAHNTNRSQIEIGAYDWHADCLTDGIIHPHEVRRESRGSLLHRVFELKKPVARARAYVASKGFYELSINGQKVGDAVLDSAWTDYSSRLLYSTWDCGPPLVHGRNEVTLMIGLGWTLSPVVILQIEIWHLDGEITTWCTDGSWKLTLGPVRENHIFHGETYDAGWQNPGSQSAFFDSADVPLAGVAKGYRPILSARMLPPIRVVETVVPVSCNQPHPGVWVFDLGKNIAGWARVAVPPGDRREVRMRYAEVIFDDGSVWTDSEQNRLRKAGKWEDFQPRHLYFKDVQLAREHTCISIEEGMINNANYRVARATDRYITAQTRGGVWEPRFVYHGFRFVELVNYPGVPDLSTLSGRMVHTDLETAGRFECSHAVLNATWEASRLTLRNNLHSVPTDCCQRDERQGWGGDLHIACEAMLMNFQAASTYIKWLQDARDSQRADGAFPDTVPHSLGRTGGDIAWGASSLFVAWYLYLHTGDLRVLQDHFLAMCRYVEFLEKKFPDFIAGHDAHYGDWLSVEETSRELVENALWCGAVKVASLAAAALGRWDVRDRWDILSGKIATQFHCRFFDPVTGRYGNGSQASQALPLHFGLVPSGNRREVFLALVERVQQAGGHVGAGVMGSKFVLEVLCEGGREDLAFQMASTTGYPGWGFMQKHGATTIWEHWEHLTGKGMNSHNHPAHCHIAGWMMKYLAGIRPVADAPGFEKVILAPVFPEGLHRACGELETLRGTIQASWYRDAGDLFFEAILPSACIGIFQPGQTKDEEWTIEGVPGPLRGSIESTHSFRASRTRKSIPSF